MVTSRKRGRERQKDSERERQRERAKETGKDFRLSENSSEVGLIMLKVGFGVPSKCTTCMCFYHLLQDL